MRIDIEELDRMVGYSRTAYYYLASEKLITKEQLDTRLAEIEKVREGLDELQKRFGPVYTSPNHIVS